MKNFLRPWSVLAALLVPVLVSSAARATVVWTSTFEAGDLSEWTSIAVNLTKGTRKNAEVVGEEVYGGKLACKITVHPDDTFGEYNQDRVDIGHVSTLSDEGKDSWLSGHYYMPANANVRNEFGFYESQNSSTNVMDFWVEPKTGGGTSISFGTGFLGANVLWTADFSIGRWHQIAIHVHWSTNANTGSVDVWFDGIQVVKAKKAQTKADGNRLFYQTGLHRKLPANFDDTIYFDDFIEADTQAEAKISAPVPSPDAGVLNQDGGETDADRTEVNGSAGTAGGSGTGAGGAAGASGAGGTTQAGASGATGAGTAGAAASPGETGAAGTMGTAGPTGSAGTGPTNVGGKKAASGGCAVSSVDDSRSALAWVVFGVIAGFTIIRRRQ